MNITEKDIEVNSNDEYYYSKPNICVIVGHKGKTGEEVKQHILKNQKIITKLKNHKTCDYRVTAFIKSILGESNDSN